jgi:Phosphatidylinositol-4-phosphate 5-Kinase
MFAWLKNHRLSEVAEKQRERERLGGKYAKVNRQLQPNLNLALRREILHYTTLAIRLSVLRCVPQDKMMEMVEVMKSHLRRAGDGSNPYPSNASKDGQGSKVASGTQSPATGTAANNTNVPSVGGGLQHDADIAIAAGARVAPFNDRFPRKADEDLSYDWRPTNIALMASLFEGGGPLDLGEFTPAAHSLAAKNAAAAAKAAGADGVSGGSGSNPAAGPASSYVNTMAGQPGAAAGGRRPSSTLAGAAYRSRHLAAAATKTAAPAPVAFEQEEGGVAAGSSQPSSASEGGVIKRPRLELRDLAPEAFGRIRDLFGVTPAQFFYSLSRTTKERFSEGASGAFMCFSHDMRFVLKTMEKDEAEVLRRMLPDYLKHLRNNRDTLIIRFYACMSLRLYRETLYFVVMENIFPTRATIHERFDLKGSWVNRSASKGAPGTVAYCRFCNERFRIGAPSSDNMCKARPNRLHVANTVLKDNDLTFKVRLDPYKSMALGDQLRSDVEFLRQQGVMDYSLLIGVHNRKFKVDNLEVMQKLLQAASSATAATAAINNAAPPALEPVKEEEGGPGGFPTNSTSNNTTGVRFAPGTRAGPSNGNSNSLVTPSGRVPLVKRNSVALTMLAEPAEGETSPRPSSTARASILPRGSMMGASSVGAIGDARRPRFSSSANAAQGPSVLAEEEVDIDDGAGSHTALAVDAQQHGDSSQGKGANGGTATANPYFHHQGTGSHPHSSSSVISAAPPNNSQGPQDDASYVPFFRADGGGMNAAVIEGPGLFYLGVIDILQEWSFIKKAERWLKRLLLLQDADGMSVMPPNDYADRFIKRVIEAVIEGQEASSATSAAAAASGMSPLPRFNSSSSGAGGRLPAPPGAAGRLAVYQPFSPSSAAGGSATVAARKANQQYYYNYQQQAQGYGYQQQPHNAVSGQRFFPEGEREEDHEPPHAAARLQEEPTSSLPFSPTSGVMRSPLPGSSNASVGSHSGAMVVGQRVIASPAAGGAGASSKKRLQQLQSYFPATGNASGAGGGVAGKASGGGGMQAAFNSPNPVIAGGGRVRVRTPAAAAAPSNASGAGHPSARVTALAEKLTAATANLPYQGQGHQSQQGE